MASMTRQQQRAMFRRFKGDRKQRQINMLIKRGDVGSAFAEIMTQAGLRDKKARGIVSSTVFGRVPLEYFDASTRDSAIKSVMDGSNKQMIAKNTMSLTMNEAIAKPVPKPKSKDKK